MGEIRNVDHRFFNLFNLKYVVTNKQGAPPYFHIEDNVYPLGAGAIAVSPLLPETSVGQSFISKGDLCGIGVFFGTYQRANTGKILFKLKESPTSKTHLYSTWIDMATVPDNSDYTISFLLASDASTLRDSKGKKFYFELTAPDGTLDNTVTLWANQQDLYPNGQLYVNGQPVSGDLGFKIYSLASEASFEEVYDGEAKVYRNHDVLPRTFVVSKAELVSDPEGSLREAKVLEKLKDENFDLRHQIIIEKGSVDCGLQIADCGLQNLQPAIHNPQSAIAEVVRYEPTKVLIKAKLDYPGFLVLADPYYPGWRAYVSPSIGSGQALRETEIFITNYCLRSVFLEQGEYEVIFKYEPISYKVGVWLTLLGISILTGVYGMSIYKNV